MITYQTPILIINDHPPLLPKCVPQRNWILVSLSEPARRGGRCVRTMQVKRLYSDYSLIIPSCSSPPPADRHDIVLLMLVHRLLIAIPDHSHYHPSRDRKQTLMPHVDTVCIHAYVVVWGGGDSTHSLSVILHYPPPHGFTCITSRMYGVVLSRFA